MNKEMTKKKPRKRCKNVCRFNNARIYDNVQFLRQAGSNFARTYFWYGHFDEEFMLYMNSGDASSNRSQSRQFLSRMAGKELTIHKRSSDERFLNLFHHSNEAFLSLLHGWKIQRQCSARVAAMNSLHPSFNIGTIQSSLSCITEKMLGSYFARVAAMRSFWLSSIIGTEQFSLYAIPSMINSCTRHSDARDRTTIIKVFAPWNLADPSISNMKYMHRDIHKGMTCHSSRNTRRDIQTRTVTLFRNNMHQDIQKTWETYHPWRKNLH